ncbi:MAG TPA: NnrU family protein [Aquabacterium sp.]|uniref:NnrU family protein n=1 Tax=Aquabacterium sp. TaxID=1872578 RepID=UPI002E337979|nr:NnrU family protein [Aquabacterium sp.]HEX5371964.1 NnrU family protein [Aquabacterium sp.]
MSQFVLGLIIFLGIHSIAIVANPLRNALAARLGEWPWKGVYALISLVGFVLLVQGWAQVRLEPTVLWTPPSWTRHLTMLLMVPVFPLLLAAYLPGRIKTAAKHPMLVATKLWALGHLLCNGSLHEVLLFGAFLAWAVADRISLKRRAPRATPQLPGTALNDVIVVVGGLALYGAFVVKGHAWLIGMPLIRG